MRVGFKGEDIGERLFLATGMMPELAVVPFISMVVNNAFFTAQRLGVFDVLQSGSKTISEIAEQTQTDNHAIQVLLEALVGFGYLDRHNGNFAVSQSLNKMLNGRMGDMARSMLEFAPDVARKFESLDEVVKSGDVADFHFNPVNTEQWGHYLTFLKLSAARPTKAIVEKIKLPRTPTRMIDVAGGPAMYSIAFCERYPALESVIIDLPESAESGAAEIDKAGMQERISYTVGNLFEVEWGEGYDLALLSNMLHCFKEEECLAVIKKAHDALAPGGTIIANEPGYPGEDGKIDTFAAFTSLLYFTVTGGRTHPTPAIESWLREAGFAEVKQHHGGNQTQVVGLKI
ncbi:MAG: methyltransferase [Pseudomonadota bacterium]